MFKNKEIIHIVAVDENKWKCKIDKAYNALMNYEVEITD